MKKVLMVITKGEIGGAQVFALNLSKKLIEKSVEVTVALGIGGFLRKKLSDEKIIFVDLKSLKRTHNPFRNLLYVCELRKILKKGDFDVVHFHTSNALFGTIATFFSKPKVKSVFTFHGLSLLDTNYHTNTVVKILYWLVFKFLISFVDKKVFVCKKNIDYAKRLKIVQDGVVIYNGIDTSENYLSQEESRRFLSEMLKIDFSNKFVIGSIGRLAYPKNYEFIIQVFHKILKIVPNSVLLIIGEGCERKRYEKIIERMNLKEKVFLPGEIEKAQKYIKAFDIFVLPSRYEGLSMTLIEAYNAGVPVLASDVGGNCEIFEDVNCLYRLNDVQDFLKKLELIIKERNFQKSNRSKNFDMEKCASEYLKIY